MRLLVPASPNWYCSRVLDCNKQGITCVGTKSNIVVWDFSSHPPSFIAYITGHQERVVGVSLQPAVTEQKSYVKLCSAGEEGKVKVWDISSKTVISEHDQHKCKPTALHWSPIDPDLIASGDEKGNVILWNPTSGETWTWMPEIVPSCVFCLTFSPGCRNSLAVGFKSGLVLILDVGRKHPSVVQRLRGHDDEIHSIVWHPKMAAPTVESVEDGAENDVERRIDDPLILTSSRDKTIRLWNTVKGKMLKVMSVPGSHRKERNEEYGIKFRFWLALCWLGQSDSEFISSGVNGELYIWNIEDIFDKPKWRIMSPGHGAKGHNRIVFNVAVCGSDSKSAISISMDRTMVLWDLEKECSKLSIPTFGGYVYALQPSPLHPGRYAVGVGDNLIRVCNFDNTTFPSDVHTFWQGIRSKVTSLAWHPNKEGLLAYGTEDGRVGILDVLSSRPSPEISNSYHRKTVYVVAWGPPTGDPSDASDFCLYSVGDCVILKHKPNSLQQDAVNVNSIIQKTNCLEGKLPGRTELSWYPDYSFVAIGNDDGRIEIFRAPDLNLVCTIGVHKKLINCLRWHPQYTAESTNLSSCRFWLASGSNEMTVHVYNLQKLLTQPAGVEAEAAIVTESFCSLEGHTNRITGLSWSLHREGFLVSCSYDWTAQVWDVKNCLPVGNYRGHHGHLLCVQWGITDPDVIYTGSDDFTLHGWNVSELTEKSPPSGNEKRSRYKAQRRIVKTKTGENSLADSILPTTGSPAVSPNAKSSSEKAKENSDDSFTEELQQLKKLLDQKRFELKDSKEQLGQGDASVPAHENKKKPDCNSSESDGEGEPVALTGDGDGLTKKEKDAKDRKKRKAKSLFPKSSSADNRGKLPGQMDCYELANIKYRGSPSKGLPDQLFHLGCYIDRRGTFGLFKEEELYHLEHENSEQHLTLQVFKGGISETLRAAADKGQLNDHMMAMAPMVSIECWEELCLKYSHQLVNEGLHHKAATYLLAANRVYEAIEMLKQNRLFKDAVCLARVRLSPTDPILQELYISWGNVLSRDGNFEQAAKCYLASGNAKEAGVCLGRRQEPHALKISALISVVAGETDMAKLYGQKFVHESLLGCDWSGIRELVLDRPLFSFLAVFSSVHEILVHSLKHLNLAKDIVPDTLEDWILPTGNEEKVTKLPVFNIGSMKHDVNCVWEPTLVRDEPLLMYVVRSWYSAWNIGLDDATIADLYRQLAALHQSKQSQTGNKQLMIEASLDVTLGLLKLIQQDYVQASNWFSSAISLYFHAGKDDTGEALCRLLLPYGVSCLTKMKEHALTLSLASCDIPAAVEGPTDAVKTNDVVEILLNGVDPGSDVISTGLDGGTAVDSLGALYSIFVIKHIVAQLTINNFQILSQLPSETRDPVETQENSKSRDVCRFLQLISRKVLWDSQARRILLTKSISEIMRACTILVSQNKLTNQGDVNTIPTNSGEIMIEGSQATSGMSTVEGVEMPIHGTEEGNEMMTSSPDENKNGHQGNDPGPVDTDVNSIRTTVEKTESSDERTVQLPDNWSTLPLDSKYKAGYITLPFLASELDRLHKELSKIAVIEGFPDPLVSAKLLLCLGALASSVYDVDSFQQRLRSWVLPYAYNIELRELFNI